MKDLITHVKNTTQFVAEVGKVFPDRLIKDESGKITGVNFTNKTPSVKKGLETIAVMRMNDTDLAELKQLKTIAILSEVALGGDLLKGMNKANIAVYDSVYDQKPYTVTLEDGSTQTITPPAQFGGFA